MDTVDIKELNERIRQESAFVDLITMEMNRVIVGQKHLVEDLLIGLLADAEYSSLRTCCLPMLWVQ